MNFCEISVTFRRISAPFPDAKRMYSLQISASFQQNFRKLSAKKPFANDPLSELLILDWVFVTRSQFVTV